MKRMDLGAVEALAVGSQLAILLAAAVVVGIFGGSLLDRQFGTSPLFLVVGSIVGMVAGIYSVVKTTKFLIEKFGRKKSTGPER